MENKTLKKNPKTKATEEKLRRLLRPKIFYGFFRIPSTLGKGQGFFKDVAQGFDLKCVEFITIAQSRIPAGSEMAVTQLSWLPPSFRKHIEF